MHLGNVYAALMSWLSVRSRGGRWILRIEDLDPQRSKLQYARQIEDDLLWLGLDWDEGGIDGRGDNGPYVQSRRSDFYLQQLRRIEQAGLTYPCYCTRADIMATQAPHMSDGRVVYAGTCRPARLGGTAIDNSAGEAIQRRAPATRVSVPDSTITFNDLICGPVNVNLARECGDFILRRADGAWAYHLAVVTDDALMGVTEVTRGNDLLLSAAQQIYLYRLLGFEPPRFAHIPLMVNENGQRLSKRDASLDMGHLRQRYTPEQLLGLIAHATGLRPDSTPVTAATLATAFTFAPLRTAPTIAAPRTAPTIAAPRTTATITLTASRE